MRATLHAFIKNWSKRLFCWTKLIAQKTCSRRDPVAGFEIEAWLVDKNMRPSPINKHFLATLNDPLASTELAKFNIEFNCLPEPLTGHVFSGLRQQFQSTWGKACQHAESQDHKVVMIGILPTLKQEDLHLGNMSDMHRYRALNEQILQTRGESIHIDISGAEHLKIDHQTSCWKLQPPRFKPTSSYRCQLRIIFIMRPSLPQRLSSLVRQCPVSVRQRTLARIQNTALRASRCIRRFWWRCSGTA